MMIARRIVQLDWINPHIDLEIEVQPGFEMPGDIGSIEIPSKETSLGIAADMRPLPIGPRPEVWDLDPALLERAEQNPLK